MKNIITFDYANKTELVFTFLISTLKQLWSEHHSQQQFGDEWDLIEDICETTSGYVTRPFFNHGFIIRQKLNLVENNGQIETFTLSVQILSGLPQFDVTLVIDNLQQQQIRDSLVSITYQDQYQNTVTI